MDFSGGLPCFLPFGVVGGAEEVARAEGVFCRGVGGGAFFFGVVPCGGVDAVSQRGDGKFIGLEVFALPRRGAVFKGGEAPVLPAVPAELHDGCVGGEDEQQGVDLQPCDGGEVGVVPRGVAVVAPSEFADDGGVVARVSDGEGVCGEFDEVGVFGVVGVGDEARGRLHGGAEVHHATAAADAACCGYVEVGELRAGAGGYVHIGTQGHGGRDFPAVECESFHGVLFAVQIGACKVWFVVQRARAVGVAEFG